MLLYHCHIRDITDNNIIIRRKNISLYLNILLHEKPYPSSAQSSFYPSYTRFASRWNGCLLRLPLFCTVICIDNDIRVTLAILPCSKIQGWYFFEYLVSRRESIDTVITFSCNVDHARVLVLRRLK